MAFEIPHPPPQSTPEPAALVRVVAREDVLWNRPIFKAPPLRLHPKAFDPITLAEELRRFGFSSR